MKEKGKDYKYDFRRLLAAFACEGEFESASPCGDGHINETFAVRVRGARAKRYVLQRVNGSLFTNVPMLMNNISLVVGHCAEKIRARGGDTEREVLQIIPARDGKLYHADASGSWRVFKFIEGATSHNIATRPEMFEESAVAFGNFSNMLSDFDATQLYDILPDFHNTPKRFQTFFAQARADRCGRAASVAEEIGFACAREEFAKTIVKLIDSGDIPLRVTHNDTKLNNVMLDDATGKALAVIDLDTVMPGSLCYDFGDSIRFGCNSSYEDERDLSKVYFRMDLFEAYARGYLSAVGDALTEAELDNLAVSAILITYETGIRFLGDHLDGDHYFHINRENQNLDRAHTQFKLVEEMERRLPEMQRVVRSFAPAMRK